jgi:hypothetical protein
MSRPDFGTEVFGILRAQRVYRPRRRRDNAARIDYSSGSGRRAVACSSHDQSKSHHGPEGVAALAAPLTVRGERGMFPTDGDKIQGVSGAARPAAKCGHRQRDLPLEGVNNARYRKRSAMVKDPGAGTAATPVAMSPSTGCPSCFDLSLPEINGVRRLPRRMD